MPKDTENIRIPDALLDAFQFGEVLTSADLNQIISVFEAGINENKKEADKILSGSSKSYIVNTVSGLGALSGVVLGDFAFVLEDDLLDNDGVTVLKEDTTTYYKFEEVGVGASAFVQKGEINLLSIVEEVTRLGEIIDDLNVEGQQADWNEDNDGSPNFIKNKPDIVESVNGKSPDFVGNVDVEIGDIDNLQTILDNIETEATADNNSSTSIYPGFTVGVSGTEEIFYSEIRVKFLDKTDPSNPATRVRTIKAGVTPTNPYVASEVYSIVYFYEDFGDLITQVDIDGGNLRSKDPKVGDPKVKVGFSPSRLSREQRKNFNTFAFASHFGTQITNVAPVGFNALQQAQNVRDLIDGSIRRDSGSNFVPSATGGALQFDITNGVIVGEGINLSDVDNSNEVMVPSEEIVSFYKIYIDNNGDYVIDDNGGTGFNTITPGEFNNPSEPTFLDQRGGDNVSAYKIIRGALPPYRTFLVYALENGVLGANGFDDDNLEDATIELNAGRIEFPQLPSNIDALTFEIGVLLTENGASSLTDSSTVLFKETAPTVRTSTVAPTVVNDTAVTNTGARARFVPAGNQKEINDIIDDTLTTVSSRTEFEVIDTDNTKLKDDNGVEFTITDNPSTVENKSLTFSSGDYTGTASDFTVSNTNSFFAETTPIGVQQGDVFYWKFNKVSSDAPTKESIIWGGGNPEFSTSLLVTNDFSIKVTVPTGVVDPYLRYARLDSANLGVSSRYLDHTLINLTGTPLVDKTVEELDAIFADYFEKERALPSQIPTVEAANTSMSKLNNGDTELKGLGGSKITVTDTPTKLVNLFEGIPDTLFESTQNADGSFTYTGDGTSFLNNRYTPGVDPSTDYTLYVKVLSNSCTGRFFVRSFDLNIGDASNAIVVPGGDTGFFTKQITSGSTPEPYQTFFIEPSTGSITVYYGIVEGHVDITEDMIGTETNGIIPGRKDEVISSRTTVAVQVKTESASNYKRAYLEAPNGLMVYDVWEFDTDIGGVIDLSLLEVGEYAIEAFKKSVDSTERFNFGGIPTPTNKRYRHIVVGANVTPVDNGANERGYLYNSNKNARVTKGEQALIIGDGGHKFSLNSAPVSAFDGITVKEVFESVPGIFVMEDCDSGYIVRLSRK